MGEIITFIEQRIRLSRYVVMSCTVQRVPVRGRAFNIKGFRRGISQDRVEQVFLCLMPGSILDLWYDKKMKMVGRIYVTPAIESVFPEFSACAGSNGEDISIEVGPFELMIWIKKVKPSLAPDLTTSCDPEGVILR